MIDLELHCHTRYSPDSLVRLPDLIERAREVGLTKLAITDHSEIEGALLAQVNHAKEQRVVTGGMAA